MEKEHILSRPLNRLFWKLSLPGIAGMLMTSANAIADAIFAGQFVGSSAMAGIALSVPLISFNFAVVRLVGSGSASIVSRAIGAGSKKVLGTILYYTIGLLLFFSLCISVTGYFFADNLIALMGGSGEVLRLGSQYYILMSLFNLPSVLGVGTSVLIRAEGKISYAMSITAIGVLLNLVLCPVLCGYFKWGVTGIAFSTIIAMSVYSVLTLRYFASGKGILFFGNIPSSVNYKLLKEIVSIGLPGFLSQFSGLFRQMFLFKVMAMQGSLASLVVFSAIYRIFSFSVSPGLGIVQALQPVAGINYGARQFTRTGLSYLVFLRNSAVLMALVALPLLLLPDMFLSLLITDMPITKTDIFYFRLLISILLFFPVFPNSITFLQAIGKGKQASWITIGRDIFLFYPMVIFCWLWGTSGTLYYGIFIENGICAILFMVFMYSVLKRLKDSVVYRNPAP